MVVGLEDLKYTVHHMQTCVLPILSRVNSIPCLAALSLDPVQFRPYSLRRGGAIFCFSRHGNPDKLMIAARWRAVKTARVSINEGLAVLAELHLPKQKLRPFTQAFHSGIRPQHLSASKRKQKGDAE